MTDINFDEIQIATILSLFGLSFLFFYTLGYVIVLIGNYLFKDE